jgi:opacity protein-like surface antigen
MIAVSLSYVAWEFLMRRLLVAGFIAVAAQSTAFAADLPILRGAFREPAPSYQTVWQGFYVGGQAGYGASSMALYEFSPIPTSNAIWPFLYDVTHRTSMFGGFAGYNAQYENVVLGFEGNYMHGTFTGVATAERIDTTFIPATTYRSDGSMTVKDFGSLRVRGGYTMGNVMPYLFAGFALGRADTARSMTVTTGTASTTIPESTKNQFVHGFAAGGGLDWMLFGGLFVRAEYEYLQLTSTVNTSIHSVRGGVGYKF